MAVNVSTTTSVCLYCKITSDVDVEKEFHEIYDEVGLELQLPALVEKFFHIKVVNERKKLLCDDCVNRLIELYDLEEHAKEEKAKAVDVVGPESAIILPEQAIKKKNRLNLTNENLINNKTEIVLPQSSTIGYGNLKIVTNEYANVDREAESENVQDSTYENLNDVELLIRKVDSPTSAKYIEDVTCANNCYEESPQENFVAKQGIEITQALNYVTSSSSKDLTDDCESLSNEVIQFEDENEDNNLNIENLVNANIIDTEISIEDFAILNASEQLTVVKSEADGNNYTYSEENNFIDENVIVKKEVDELETSSNFSQSEEVLEEIHVEELENDYYEEEFLNVVDMENTEDTEENELENGISLESDLKSNEQNISGEEVDEGHTIENDEETVDDTYSIEEEYLIEEINCSEEYDCIDINEYLDKVLLTKFQDLELDWEVECKLCLDKYLTFQELLKHACIAEFEDEQQFTCLFKDCEENVYSLSALARHLILRHYDQLESTPIYGKCPDCQKSFSNFIDFNKHSCCRTIKRKAGSPNYCQYCDMDFQSLKRFVFHMQFHLTNHRPKVCLLCGDIFKTSNDLFEHTQYKHNPDAAMACIQCDRFFKEKEVFDSHMDLHEDSKYQFACDYCPKKYTNKIGLSSHMDVYHNNKSKAIKCYYCEKEFVNNNSYRNHIKSHADDVQIESFICTACGLISNSSEFIKEHIESDKDLSCFTASIEEKILSLGYTCENCSVDFHTLKDLKQHRLSDNHNDELFHCGVCRRAFKTLRHMRNHSINHKDFEKWQEAFPITRYFVCNIGDCEEFYPIWTTLYYHKKRPHKTKESSNKSNEFKCQFCHQLCSSKMSLAVHVARSHNNSNVVCPHCKRAHKTQKLLQDHIDKFHTPVKCDICLKDFKNLRNLESHNRLVHLNIKRYFCKYCEKGYFHKSEKDAHETKAHPEFSYKCELCSFITNYPKSMEIHMDNHNNQLKFKCSICNKAFGRKQLLRLHLKRHENKKEYICSNYLTENGCDASFYTFSLLKTHIQTKHDETKFQKATDKRKRTLENHLEVEVVKFDADFYEILDCDEDSASAKRSKNSNDDNKYEEDEDTIELAFENKLQSDEKRSDDEYII